MGYLFGVMWMCLAMAFLLGVLLSYFWRRARYRKLSADSEQSWLSRLRQTEQDRDSRIARLTSEVEEHRQQIPTMEKSLAERSGIISALENTVEEHMATIDRLRSRLDDSQSEETREGLRAESERANRDAARIAELEKALHEGERAAAALDGELDQLRKKHNEANARAIKAEERLQRLDGEQQKQQALSKGHASAVDAVTEKLAGAEQRVADLKQELSSVNSRYSRLESEHGGCASQLAAVTGKLKELRGELDRQNERTSALQQRLDTRQSELESSRAQVEKLGAQLQNQEKSAQRAAELELNIQEMRDESARQAQSAAQADLRKTELEQTLRSRNEKLAAEERQNEELRNKVAELESLRAQSQEKNRVLESELASAVERSAEARNNLASLRQRAEKLERDMHSRELSETDARRRAEHWQNEHDKLKAQLSNQSSLADSAQQEVRKLRHELSQATGVVDEEKIKRLNAERRLDEAEHAAAEKSREFKLRIEGLEEEARRAVDNADEVGMLRRTLKQRDAEFAQEHQECEVQRTRANDWRTRYEALKAEHDEVMAAHKKGKRKRVAKKPVPVTGEMPDWLLEEAPEESDDLKKIKGVGPVMERTMNQLGIYLYRQVAALRKKDIDWIATHIDTFPGRITRDDWKGQAVRLRKEKYGR